MLETEEPVAGHDGRAAHGSHHLAARKLEIHQPDLADRYLASFTLERDLLPQVARPVAENAAPRDADAALAIGQSNRHLLSAKTCGESRRIRCRLEAPDLGLAHHQHLAGTNDGLIRQQQLEGVFVRCDCGSRHMVGHAKRTQATVRH